MEHPGEKNKAGGLIVYSSKTGDTRKLAEGIRCGLAEALGQEPRIGAVEENPDPAGAGAAN
jgi:flavodoxin